jgi:hypothetical protein
MSSTFLVFDSQSDFRSSSTRFQFTYYCLQSTPNRCHYQIFLFGGDAAGLSVAICYGASKSYAPTRNLATYHRVLFVMAFCCDYVSEQNFELNLPLWQKLFFLRILRASRSKIWVIYHLIESFRCYIWYHAFLLDQLKFDGIASSHFCIAPYHMHHLTIVFITLSKSVSI